MSEVTKEEVTKEEIKETVKEALKDFQNTVSNQPLNCSESVNFGIRKIDNGFLVDFYNGMRSNHLFAETREKAIDMVQELVGSIVK